MNRILFLLLGLLILENVLGKDEKKCDCDKKNKTKEEDEDDADMRRRAIVGTVINEPGSLLNGVPVGAADATDTAKKVEASQLASGAEESMNPDLKSKVKAGLGISKLVESAKVRRDYYGKVDASNKDFANAADKSKDNYFGKFKESDHPELFH